MPSGRTGGRRHGRDFDHFRWTSGTLSKVLRSPSLKGHRTHGGQTVRDGAGAPVLIGQPLLSDAEFDALQAVLQTRSNGTRRPRSPTSALLIGVAHCRGCGGRMYFAARKDHPHGDYVCRATARGEVCPAPAGVRSDWLEQTRWTATGERQERRLLRPVRTSFATESASPSPRAAGAADPNAAGGRRRHG
ncbi:zinc ribbon domain-containing protein [Streptomyces olivaceoviridis]|uniref:zinc ribbon domain-containing protein n=1 Tax=Streptomyces olivaceoviridis TaxID=1921 RepID=UPI0036C914DE